MIAVVVLTLVTFLAQTPGQLRGTDQDRTVGSISGIVRDGVSAAPLAFATVRLTSQGRDVGAVLTDGAGRFILASLPRGRQYEVNASKPGFLATSRFNHTGFGQQGPIALGDKDMRQLTLTLYRAAAIGGTITDEAGTPVAGTLVRSALSGRVRGEETLIDGPTAITDDRGVYQIQNLIAGSFIVFVSGSGVLSGASNELTFFPGVYEIEAATQLTVEYGAILRNIDFRLPSQTSGRVLSGSIRSPARGDISSDAESVELHLVPYSATNRSGPVGLSTRVSVGGDFIFRGVRPGRYRLLLAPGLGRLSLAPSAYGTYEGVRELRTARGPTSRLRRPVAGNPPMLSFIWSSDRLRLWASQLVDVSEGQDVSNIEVMLSETIDLDGRISWQGDPPDLRNEPSLTIDPSPTNSIVVVPQVLPIDQDNTTQAARVTIRGLLPGTYYVRTPSPLVVKALTINGRKEDGNRFAVGQEDANGILTVALVIGAEIRGSAVRSDGQPAAHEGVVCFPADRRQWHDFGFVPTRLRSVRSDSAGSFRVTGVPAGDYYCGGVVSTDVGYSWEDEALMQSILASGSRVQLEWNTATKIVVNVATRR